MEGDRRLRWAAGLALALLAAVRWRRAAAARHRADRAAARRAKLSPGDVVIVGCGFSGICAAIKLQEAGIPFVILEKANGVGGTWHYNTYPGAACDVPAHLYSFSFELNPNWSRAYAPYWEIKQYLERVMTKYGLWEHLHLNTEVDTAEWDAKSSRWQVRTRNGESYTPRFLVNGIGVLHQPKFPDVPGFGSFKGEAFHTAEWDHSIDLTGKKVVAIGCGASAVQFVPPVAEKASHFTLIQRTPNWVLGRHSLLPIMPKEQTPRWMIWIFSNIPGAMRLYRNVLLVLIDSLLWPSKVLNRDGFMKRLFERLGKHEMTMTLKQKPELLEKSMPEMRIGCKRICFADDYLKALVRDNVEVLKTGVTRIVEDGVITSEGKHVPADVLIYATGFDVGSIGRTKIQGTTTCVEGRSAADDGLEAYLGISVVGMPNSFMLLGPNTTLAHNSLIRMIEAQVAFMVRTMVEAIDTDVECFDIKPQVVEEYNSKLQSVFKDRVWNYGGCSSWYLNKKGKVFVLWPNTTLMFHRVANRAPSLRKAFNTRM